MKDPDDIEVNASYVVSPDDPSVAFEVSLIASEGGGVSGGGQALRGEHVTVSAVPDRRYLFAGWYEDGALVEGANESYCFRVEDNRVLEARFEPKPLPDPCAVEVLSTTFTYNGLPRVPDIVVRNADGDELSEDVDYEYEFGDCTKPGAYKATARFTGDYEGLDDHEVSWKILPQKASLNTLDSASGTVVVTWAAKPAQADGYEIQLATSSDFKLDLKTVMVAGGKAASEAVSGLVKDKKYWVRVRMVRSADGAVQGAWSAAKARYAFAPKTMKVNKLKPAKKSATVKWKKLSTSQASGYEVQYGLNAYFKRAKTLVVKKAKASSAKIKKLKSKKKYFFRIRAYKMLDGAKYVGAWSKAKKAKVR